MKSIARKRGKRSAQTAATDIDRLAMRMFRRFNFKAINRKLRAVARRAGLKGADIHDAAFHMTDWLEELAMYAVFCTHPDAFDAKTATLNVFGFLNHAPHHLAAAHKLYTGKPLSDVFGIGATTENTPAELHALAEKERNAHSGRERIKRVTSRAIHCAARQPKSPLAQQDTACPADISAPVPKPTTRHPSRTARRPRS